MIDIATLPEGRRLSFKRESILFHKCGSRRRDLSVLVAKRPADDMILSKPSGNSLGRLGPALAAERAAPTRETVPLRD